MVGMARDLRAPCGRAGISALSKWLPCPPLDQPCVWSQGTVANKPSRPCPPGGRRSMTPSAGLFPARHGAPRAGPGRLVPCKVKWEPGPGSPRCSSGTPRGPASPHPSHHLLSSGRGKKEDFRGRPGEAPDAGEGAASAGAGARELTAPSPQISGLSPSQGWHGGRRNAGPAREARLAVKQQHQTSLFLRFFQSGKRSRPRLETTKGK